MGQKQTYIFVRIKGDVITLRLEKRVRTSFPNTILDLCERRGGNAFQFGAVDSNMAVGYEAGVTIRDSRFTFPSTRTENANLIRFILSDLIL